MQPDCDKSWKMCRSFSAHSIFGQKVIFLALFWHRKKYVALFSAIFQTNTNQMCATVYRMMKIPDNERHTWRFMHIFIVFDINIQSRGEGSSRHSGRRLISHLFRVARFNDGKMMEIEHRTINQSVARGTLAYSSSISEECRLLA